MGSIKKAPDPVKGEGLLALRFDDDLKAVPTFDHPLKPFDRIGQTEAVGDQPIHVQKTGHKEA